MAKTVFTYPQCAHVWVSQSQAFGKSPKGAMYFEGATLYSYRDSFPIGHFVTMPDGTKVVLTNNKRCSNNTSRHQDNMNRALDGSGHKVIELHHCDDMEALTRLAKYWNSTQEYLAKDAIARLEGTIDRHVNRITAVCAPVTDGLKKGRHGRLSPLEALSFYTRSPILSRYEKFYAIDQSLKALKDLTEFAYLVSGKKLVRNWATRFQETIDKAIADRFKLADKEAKTKLKDELKLARNSLGWLSRIESEPIWLSLKADIVSRDTFTERAECILSSDCLEVLEPAATIFSKEMIQAHLDRAIRYRKMLNIAKPSKGEMALSKLGDVYAASELKESGYSKKIANRNTWVKAINGSAIKDLVSMTIYDSRKESYWHLMPDSLRATVARTISEQMARKELVANHPTRIPEHKRYGRANKPVSFAQWQNGEGNSNQSYVSTYVRRVGNTLQTSRGAEAPFKEAVIVFKLAQDCYLKNKAFIPKGSIRAGSFDVRHIHANGDLQIGCHYIAFEEMRRLAIQEIPDRVATKYPAPAIIA